MFKYLYLEQSVTNKFAPTGFYFRNEKRLSVRIAFVLNRSLAMTYSHMGTPTLPSALLRFTSEFGMGSGGSTTLLSLDKNLFYNFES